MTTKTSRAERACSLFDLLSEDELSLITSHVADVYAPNHLTALGSTCQRMRAVVQPAVESVARLHAEIVLVSNKAADNGKRVASTSFLLTSSSTPRRAKLMAAAAVAHMASSSHEHCEKNRATLAEAGSVAPLVGLFHNHAPFEDEILAAALANLALSSAINRAAIVAAGALPPLVAMLRSSSPSARHAAAATIGNLAVHDRDNKMAVARAGALAPLMDLMTTSVVPQTRMTAAEVLRTLARAPAVHRLLTEMGCPRSVPRDVPVASGVAPAAAADSGCVVRSNATTTTTPPIACS